MQERVTLKSIADNVGVTPAVVSHVLSGMTRGNIRVGKKKQEEILNTSKMLGYVPQLSARQMVKKRSFTIGIVMVMYPKTIPAKLLSLSADYLHEAMLGVEAVCREYNYNCLVNVQRINEEFEIPRMMHDGSVDGVIIIGPSNEAILQKFAQAKIYCVQVGSNVPRDMGIKFVSVDLNKKFCEVSEACFRQYGFTRQMACLCKGPGPEEIAAHFVALNERIPELRNESIIGPSDLEKPYTKDIFRGILTRSNRPEVIFADPLYIGSIIEAANEIGLKIPNDLSVLTYGVESLRWHLEGMYGTSIGMITFSIEEVGYRAALLLLKKIGDYHEDVACLTECQFANGETCVTLDIK